MVTVGSKWSLWGVSGHCVCANTSVIGGSKWSWSLGGVSGLWGSKWSLWGSKTIDCDVVYHCCMLLYIVVCYCTLLYVVVCCCTLLYVVVHCCMLLYIVVCCWTLLYVVDLHQHWTTLLMLS